MGDRRVRQIVRQHWIGVAQVATGVLCAFPYLVMWQAPESLIVIGIIVVITLGVWDMVEALHRMHRQVLGRQVVNLEPAPMSDAYYEALLKRLRQTTSSTTRGIDAD